MVHINLKLEQVRAIIDREIASLTRANVKEINPLIKDLRNKDIAELSDAKNSATEKK